MPSAMLSLTWPLLIPLLLFLSGSGWMGGATAANEDELCSVSALRKRNMEVPVHCKSLKLRTSSLTGAELQKLAEAIARASHVTEARLHIRHDRICNEARVAAAACRAGRPRRQQPW